MNSRIVMMVAVAVFCSGCVAYYPSPYSYRPYPYSYSYYGYQPFYYPAYRPPVYYAPAWPIWYPSLSLGFGYYHYKHHGGRYYGYPYRGGKY